MELHGKVLVHHVQGGSEALVLLPRPGRIPMTLGNNPVNGHFRVKKFISEDRHGGRVCGDAVHGDDARLLTLPLKNPACHHGRGWNHQINNFFLFFCNQFMNYVEIFIFQCVHSHIYGKKL